MTTDNDLGYDHILWLDLETTGADREKDCILEIGWVLTDVDLTEITCGSDVVKPIYRDWYVRVAENDVVFEMHKVNNLLHVLQEAMDENTWESPEKVAADIIDVIQEYGARRKRTILAGSGVSHFDRDFLRTEMPALLDFLSYPQLDVGQFRRFMRQAGLQAVCNAREAKPDSKAHRGLDDAYDHLDESRYYLDWLRKADRG